MKEVFNDSGDFEATRAAEIWCAKNGVSVGTMCCNEPRGLMRGDTMTGNPRSGPITVEISE